MEEIKGFFYKILYKDYSSGFAIFTINTENCKYSNQLGDLKCKVNILLDYSQKTPVKVKGTWNEDTQTFDVMDIKEDSTQKILLKNYIISTFASVGNVMAGKIVEEFDDFFVDMTRDDASTRLKNIGFKEEVIPKFIEYYTSNFVKWEILCYIMPYGGRYNHMERLYERYGKNSITALKEKTYEVCRNIKIPFVIADRIACEAGKDCLDESRLLSIIAEISKQMEKSGDTYWTVNDFINRAMEFKTEAIKDTVPGPCYCNIITDKNPYVYYEKCMVYNKFLDMCENRILKDVKRLKKMRHNSLVDEKAIKKIEDEQGFDFSSQQKKAFELATSPGVKVLTGGPGTGKTSTVSGFIKYFLLKNPNAEIKCCAPTARAAQRMKETTGMEATTIHQLLGLKAYEEYTEVEPLSADLIIVDEFSMADVIITSILFSACKTGSTILCVGDINQLASVGPGDVLNDLIKSYRVPVCRLIDVYRQAKDSNIIMNSIKVNNGEFDLKQGDDFVIYEADDEKTLLEKCCAIVDMEKTDDPFHVQVLSPIHKGDIGVSSLNLQLQQMINTNKKKFVYGDKKFLLEDKVIMTRNNFEIGYCNGDIGEIKDIKEDYLIVKIGENELEISGMMLEDMELAYCTTVHKAQGSEFPVVVVVLPIRSPIMLKRNLLYTAITRAKKRVYILTEGLAVNVAIATIGTGTRNTRLCHKLRQWK